MKRGETKKVFHRAPQSGTSREVDPALVKFVEALAIADTRRDHLFESERLMKIALMPPTTKCISGAAIYAQFSTELQNQKSTEDQIALCRAYAARHQLNVVATF